MKKLFILLTLAGLLAFSAAAQANTFVLSGNVLDVGVGSYGSLPDDYFTAGIVYKPAGPGSDILGNKLNTSPFEVYSIGAGGHWYAIGWGLGAFVATSYDTSSASSLSALTATGAFNLNGANLIYMQNIFFAPDSNRINFSVDIINAGTVPATNVVYSRILNPEPDRNVNIGGSATINSIPAPNRVRAVGPLTNLYIDLVDLTGGGLPSVGFPGSPYELLNPQNLGNGDYTIDMAWNIGTLAPGRSYEIDFYYEIGVVPAPPTILLLGTGIISLLGLRGFTRKI
jgi:hypothetical protein